MIVKRKWHRRKGCRIKYLEGWFFWVLFPYTLNQPIGCCPDFVRTKLIKVS